MTTDERALLAAIWAEPHDDTARLVYADWVDEHDRPDRAAFIRLQIELAKLDEWDEDRRPALVKREQFLWKKHAKGWKAGLPKLVQNAAYVRGFPNPRPRGMGAQFQSRSQRIRVLPVAAWHDSRRQWRASGLRCSADERRCGAALTTESRCS